MADHEAWQPEGDVVVPPGSFYFGAGPRRVSTLLGSCVAITFWHPVRGLGGMCHYLLPSRGEYDNADPTHLDGRYADEAVQLLLEGIKTAATTPDEYQVKIFGGGSQFSAHSAAGIDVPQRNIIAGLELLTAIGIRPHAQHLGGTGSRQIILDLGDGRVWVRHAASLAEVDS